LKQTFKKGERLSSEKSIATLFAEGDSFFQYPFKVVYKKEQSTYPFSVQLLISVSKRNFKKAVDRNKIKRLIREAYRKSG